MTDKENDTKKTTPAKTELAKAQTPESETAKPATAPVKGGGKGLAALALLIALGAGAGSGYLGYLWYQEKRMQLSEFDSRLQTAMNQTVQRQDAALKPLKDQLASQQAGTEALRNESQTLKGVSQNLQSAVQTLQSALQTVQQETETQRGDAQIRKNQIQALQDQVQALQGDLQALNDRFGIYTKEQQSNWAQLDNRIVNLQLAERSLLTTLENVRAVVARGGDVNALPLAEVEYLLRIADHKLKLQRDVKGAIEALEVAVQRLKGVNESAFLSVQGMIAENIASLRGVDLPDRSALAHKIVEMELRVNSLALRNQAQLATLKDRVKPHLEGVGESAEVAQEPWWQRFSTAAWEQFKDILVIRHERSTAPPLIAVQEQYFLIQNLRLELEAMRLGLLNNDAISYQESNELARNWVQTYFDTDDPAVAEFLSELKALQAVQFNPYLPDVASTLRAFRDVMERRQPVRSVAPSTTPETDQAPAKETPQ